MDLKTVIEKIKYDLRIDPDKIAVKTSNPVIISKAKRIMFWDFDIRSSILDNGKNKKVATLTHNFDYYLLVGLIDDMPKKYFLISAADAPSSHIRISVAGESKYNQYAIQTA